LTYPNASQLIHFVGEALRKNCRISQLFAAVAVAAATSTAAVTSGTARSHIATSHIT
jgi:hypothetical protein